MAFPEIFPVNSREGCPFSKSKPLGNLNLTFIKLVKHWIDVITTSCSNRVMMIFIQTAFLLLTFTKHKHIHESFELDHFPFRLPSYVRCYFGKEGCTGPRFIRIDGSTQNTIWSSICSHGVEPIVWVWSKVFSRHRSNPSKGFLEMFPNVNTRVCAMIW